MGAHGFGLGIMVNALEFGWGAEIQKSEIQISIESLQLNGLFGDFEKFFWANSLTIFVACLVYYNFYNWLKSW
jgi:hypothetical protein